MSHNPAVDALSDMFDRIEVEGVMTGGFAVRGPWTSGGELTRPFKLIALVAGTADVWADGPGGPIGPIDLMPGDVVLLSYRTHLRIRGGSGTTESASLIPETNFDATSLATADLDRDDVLIGGAIRVGPAGSELLRNALPGMVHVAATRSTSSRSSELVRQLFEEASGSRVGSAFAIRQNAQLLLLEVLRAHLEHDQPAMGWLRLLGDESLAPALRRMHAEPGRSWGLEELATAAGMSRTIFAERFRRAAGEPPLTYLTRWRMVLAQRALEDPDVRIGALAAQLGYASDSAFSNAFKRIVGEAPLHYRRHAGDMHRATSSSAPSSL
ncbi:helix-turn-helix transcriptional regulator [Rhodococcoides yunnanense]|uniref:helix-turn-helix transcriptional regulator n=1 Tax=Rhodococcoides yunnanense TaxID=278209 RepID=UPI0009326ABD|nr:AraC family transcriptional regulator [Rhodococcus yunnanensis]